MEFHANNPTAPTPVAVMMVYNNTPAAVMALKKSGHQDAGRPERQRSSARRCSTPAQGLPDLRQGEQHSGVAVDEMDPLLRETMLVRGDVDAITGFSFTSLLNPGAGVKPDDGSCPPLSAVRRRCTATRSSSARSSLAKNPAAVKAFLRAFSKG